MPEIVLFQHDRSLLAILNKNYFLSVNADEMIDMNIIFILDEIQHKAYFFYTA